MRRYLALPGLMLALASPAFAQSTSTSASNSNSGSAASIVNNAPAVVRSRAVSDVTASAFAPGLTAAGINSCAGSVSGGVGGTGFNFGVGGTYEMGECTARANAAALAGLGLNLAALESLCQSENMRKAINASGTVCPSQRAGYAEAQRRADETGRLYVAEELAEPLPPAPDPRQARRRRAGTRAAIAVQASNSGPGISQSAGSRR